MPLYNSPQIRVSVGDQRRTSVRTVIAAPNIYDTSLRLSALSDVDTTGASTNDTLVYDGTEQKYVIKTLPVVDGGTF